MKRGEVRTSAPNRSVKVATSSSVTEARSTTMVSGAFAPGPKASATRSWARRSVELVGEEVALALRDASLRIFTHARQLAAERGVLLADTKFEFGADPLTGELTLADEVTRAHGGELTIENSASGGAIVRWVFPAYETGETRTL